MLVAARLEVPRYRGYLQLLEANHSLGTGARLSKRDSEPGPDRGGVHDGAIPARESRSAVRKLHVFADSVADSSLAAVWSTQERECRVFAAVPRASSNVLTGADRGTDLKSVLLASTAVRVPYAEGDDVHRKDGGETY